MSRRIVAALIAVAVVSIAGVVFSGLLYYSSVSLAAGITGSSLCKIGESMNCAPALTSRYASIAGIPLPALSGAFYLSVLGLVIGVRFTPSAEREKHVEAIARFLTLTFGVAAVASIGLAYVAFALLPAPCPFCIALYVVNGFGLGLGIVLRPHLKALLTNLGVGIRGLVQSGPIQSALIVFVASLVVATASYGWAASRMRQASQEAQRQAGLEAANELTEPGELEIDTTGLPRLGPADAPVTLVEFSDFECPFCSRFAETVHQVHKAYPDDVAIYFVHFPLDGACNPAASSMHPSACLAARAAVCAHEQDNFWQMHDAIFAFFSTMRERNEHRELTESDLMKFSEAMRLQPEQFLSCLTAKDSQDAVVRQVMQAQQVGVRSTPTWLINGHLRTGARPFDYMQPQVERLLELHRKKQAAPASTPPAAPEAAEPAAH